MKNYNLKHFNLQLKIQWLQKLTKGQALIYCYLYTLSCMIWICGLNKNLKFDETNVFLPEPSTFCPKTQINNNSDISLLKD